MTTAEMSKIMNTLYLHREQSLPPTVLADIFDRMLWCLDDDAPILQVREEWLMSDDRGRVEIALAMDETFPFTDVKQMNEVLGRISDRWPDLSAACQHIRERRTANERNS